MTTYYTVTGGCGAHGSWRYCFSEPMYPGYLNGGASVPAGQNQMIIFTPDVGYTMDTVTDTASQNVQNGFAPYAGTEFISNAVGGITCNHSIYGTFKVAPTVTITASAGSNGSISPSGTQTVNKGSSLTFTCIPASGYSVDYVLVDGVNVGSVSSYTFGNIQSNHTISVVFTNGVRTITASAGIGGTITPSGSVGVTNGQSKSFAISANAGYQIDDVKVDGSSVGKVSSYVFSNVVANHTIAATFKLFDSFLITATAGANGIITPSGSTAVVKGASKTFVITPNANYDIADVLVDGVSVGKVSSYTFSNVQTAHTIAVTFSILVYRIVSIAGAHGTITPSGETFVNHGSSQGYTIVPDENYVIQDILVDGIPVTLPASGTLFID